MADPLPDLLAMTLPELLALQTALRMAVRALDARGGGDFDTSIMADAEGVSVILTIPINPQP